MELSETIQWLKRSHPIVQNGRSMGQGWERAELYRQRAAEMRLKAENAQTEELKAPFVRLEAAWLRLAAAAEKGDTLEDLPGPDLTGNC